MKPHFTGKTVDAPQGKVTYPSSLTISIPASPSKSTKSQRIFFLIKTSYKINLSGNLQVMAKEVQNLHSSKFTAMPYGIISQRWDNIPTPNQESQASAT